MTDPPRDGSAGSWEEPAAESLTPSPRQRFTERTARVAEVMLSTDAQLVSALDPSFEGLSPREVLELLVAGDIQAWWRLREQTMEVEQLEDAWHREGWNAGPGEWRIAMVIGLLRRYLVLGEEGLSSEVLSNLAAMIDLAAAECARHERARKVHRRRAA